MKRFLYIAVSTVCIGAAAAQIPAAGLPGVVYAETGGPGMPDADAAASDTGDGEKKGPHIGKPGPDAVDLQPSGPGAVGSGYTGGSSSRYTRRQEVGPGVQEENSGDTSLLPTIYVPNDLLDRPFFDPIVKEADPYTFEQMESQITALQQRYGDKVQVNTIGTSLDGRAIYEIVVGNVNAPKHVLIQGAIHGREHMTPLIMMKQIEMALTNYDAAHYDRMPLSRMFEQVALHFVPMANPDGVTLSQSGIAGIRTENVRQAVMECYNQDVALGRTSRELDDYLRYWKSNGRGVDLNQNFPAQWESLTAAAQAPSYAGYKGQTPLSEPESQALAGLTESRRWTAAVSYHSMGNIIYWDTENNGASAQSYSLAESISSVSGYRLNNSMGKGGYKDWVQTNGSATPGVTIEVGSVACPMPLSEFAAAWEQNRTVWAQILSWAVSSK